MSKCLYLAKGMLLAVMLSCANLYAQDQIPFHTQKYSLDSRATVQTLQATAQGTEDGQSGARFEQVIQVPGANWLRLEFGDHDLGESGYIVLTSSEDGGRQRMDAGALVNYRNRSAFFNGDTVILQLFDQAGSADIFITVTDIYFGLPGDREKAQPLQRPALDQPHKQDALVIQPEEICGSTDDRVAASVPRATGRFVFFDPANNYIAKCTAWIAAYGIHFSAGHCFQRVFEGDPELMEFDVPDSDANGDPNFADPEDQYPVDVANFDAVDDRNENGLGDDWAVFRVNANSNSGLRPIEGRNNYFHMAKPADVSVPSITISGYGIDTGTANRTLQTDNGPYLGETGSGSVVYLEYQVDTRSGNSGGPVISGSASATPISLGIHSHAGCDADNGNHGTSFENNALESAAEAVGHEFVEGLMGRSFVDIRYVDAGHPIATTAELGTMLRPYDTVTEAVNAVPSDGAVMIAPGDYSGPANTFVLGADGRSMFLVSPGGSVTIGN